MAIQISVPIIATAIVTTILMICAMNNCVSPKNKPFHLATSLTVSYTHLDVYKRQALHRDFLHNYSAHEGWQDILILPYEKEQDYDI